MRFTVQDQDGTYHDFKVDRETGTITWLGMYEDYDA